MSEVKSFKSLKPEWRKYCSLWRSYPDLFLDHIKDPDSHFNLYFYQRVMLRVLARNRYVYMTFTRGTAKSFTQIMNLFLKCIFFPRAKYFITAPRKEQASKIAKENLDDILTFFPILKHEINWKASKFEKDYTKVVFMNGSRFDVVQVSNASRGGRRHGGSVEEIVDEAMKKDLLQEVVIPMMANDRQAMNGQVDKEGEHHKFQHFITTAGTRQSFAYEKLQEIIGMMKDGKSAFSIGAGYDLACMHGQLDEEFINEVRESPTTNPLGFAREYMSTWTGTSDNSLVSLDDFLESRVLRNAEFKADEKDKQASYVLSYDVARAEGSQNASCALSVIKIIDRGDGTFQKHLVNMFTFEGTHFRSQALFIKQKVNEFKARIVVIDVNGLGKGLVDYLVTEIDENPAYEVVNDDRYDVYKTDNSIPMVFGVSSQTKETKAGDIHNVFMNTISNHGIKMLVSESQAKVLPKFKKMKDEEKKAEELLPFTMIDFLQEEVMNLEYEKSGNNTKVRQISKSIQKDKFSSLEYGIFYIYLLEQKNKTRRTQHADISKFFMGKQASAT